ncbi:hypothetical protein RDI58_026728 [Solanum bulbocastanum]|uniref:Uncharacterized protein n=1 Tax=Solanum bulbocastanum TaxID=147425 RepID=A0AAN8SZM1_SOLBU
MIVSFLSSCSYKYTSPHSCQAYCCCCFICNYTRNSCLTEEQLINCCTYFFSLFSNTSLHNYRLCCCFWHLQ